MIDKKNISENANKMALQAEPKIARVAYFPMYCCFANPTIKIPIICPNPQDDCRKPKPRASSFKISEA